MADDTVPQIISRKEARGKGLAAYFTGKPCVHGHLMLRHTSNGACYGCRKNKIRTPQSRAQNAAYARAYYAANKDMVRAKAAAKYAENPEEFRARSAAWLAANPEKYRDQLRRSSAANLSPEQLKRRSEKDKRQREKNKEKRHMQSAAWFAKNPNYRAEYNARNAEIIKQKRRAWIEAHPEEARAKNSQRRARLRNAPGNGFTRADLAKLRERQKRCHICGKPLTKKNPGTIDHIIALADGGANDASNISLAHSLCNKKKHSKRTHLL